MLFRLQIYNKATPSLFCLLFVMYVFACSSTDNPSDGEEVEQVQSERSSVNANDNESQNDVSRRAIAIDSSKDEAVEDTSEIAEGLTSEESLDLDKQGLFDIQDTSQEAGNTKEEQATSVKEQSLSELRAIIKDGSPEEVAHLIANLPSWPVKINMYLSPISSSEIQFTPSEWRRYLTLAAVLQESPNEKIRNIFIAYSDPDKRPKSAGLHKSVILLRLMFEIPLDFELKRYPRGVKPYGGIGAWPLEGREMTRKLTQPVEWTQSGPRLTLARAAATIMGTNSLSIPIKEFDYFRANFQYRRGLLEFLDE